MLDAFDVVYSTVALEDGSTIVTGKVAKMNQPIEARRFGRGFRTSTPFRTDIIPAYLQRGARGPMLGIVDYMTSFNVEVLDDELRSTKTISMPWNYDVGDFIALDDGRLVTVGVALCHPEAKKASRVIVDPRSGAIRSAPGGTPHRARGGAGKLENGDVVVAGGHDPCTGEQLDTTEVFSASKGTWSVGPRLTSRGDYSAMVVLPHRKVLLLGARRVLIDLATGITTAVGIGRAYEHGALVGDQTVLVAGGDPASDSTSLIQLVGTEYETTSGPPLRAARGALTQIIGDKTGSVAYVLGGGVKTIEEVEVSSRATPD